MQVTPAEGLWLGSSRCGGGSRCGQLWEGSWTGGGQPPAERASLASALPGCSISQQRCCLHTLHRPAPFLAGDLFFFVGRGGGGRWSTAQPLFGKKRREPLLLRQKSSACDGSPQTPLPSQALRWRLTRGSPVSVLPRSAPRVPSLPADPPFPSPAFPQNPDSPRVGAPACLPSSAGAKPQDEVGGPPRLPRAGFSLWTLQPRASGRSSEPPRETYGRWEGRGFCAPCRGAGQMSPNPARRRGGAGEEGLVGPGSQATGDPGAGRPGA